MPETARKANLSLHLVQVLDGVWTLKTELRELADQAQFGVQDACSDLGVEVRHAAPEILERADALVRAVLDERVKAAAAKLRELAAKLEEG